MTESERSTFSAISNALYSIRLTDSKGKALGRSIELIDVVDTIAGQDSNKRSDEQYRLYVTLRPDAYELLQQSREFNRARDNRRFHRGYPVNFRQVVSAPGVQFSISRDKKLSDIDVDYKSSGIAGLWNGHLTAANSDVRARGNYPTHLRRWRGLVDWWRPNVPDLIEEFRQNQMRPLSSQFVTAANSPDAPEAEIVAKTADEFFRLWLVQRDRRRAANFIGKRFRVCTSSGRPDPELEARTKVKAFSLMEAANRNLGRRRSIGAAIRSFESVDDGERLIDHSERASYTLLYVKDKNFDDFVCGIASERPSRPNATPEPYYLTNFQVIMNNGTGGVASLMWVKEDGNWRIQAFDVLSE
jgi:hypothetical protein